jgi:hypothetical protein
MTRVAPSFATRDTGGPAIVIFAAANIRELRFGAQPDVRISLRGALGDSVRVLERRNLPDQIVPGTTYRDVYVAVEILGHLNAQCISALITGGVADSAGAPRRCAGVERDSSAVSRPRR